MQLSVNFTTLKLLSYKPCLRRQKVTCQIQIKVNTFRRNSKGFGMLRSGAFQWYAVHYGNRKIFGELACEGKGGSEQRASWNRSLIRRQKAWHSAVTLLRSRNTMTAAEQHLCFLMLICCSALL